ncbi:hypothetical protein BJ508DRAFT_165298 [Ascobolus immersus RN42]|uniref:Uncharacterized protein n=1 Tax=Ascobolus immersus RN42 TaxID=1160509 RepID=A0A3N4HV12_ASCIM|nr:hypothetical protein BJ508DRAFT_165298 [Ascobolus immersus RN42]
MMLAIHSPTSNRHNRICFRDREGSFEVPATEAPEDATRDLHSTPTNSCTAIVASASPASGPETSYMLHWLSTPYTGFPYTTPLCGIPITFSTVRSCLIEPTTIIPDHYRSRRLSVQRSVELTPTVVLANYVELFLSAVLFHHSSQLWYWI